MNVLFISWFFPPLNDVAALRTGAIARHLIAHGHNVHVLTAARSHPDPSLIMPVPENVVTRTAWFDIDRLGMAPPPSVLLPVPKSPAAKGGRSRFPFLSALRANITHIPDRQTGWRRYAIREGRRLIKAHSIDLILASAPPFTGHLAAKSLSAEFGIPWVAEYRDGWSHYAYTPRQPWRQKLDEIMEDRTAETASGIVAVSEPWAEFYAARYGKPTVAIYNGFDQDQVLAKSPDLQPTKAVTITYVGGLYDGLRDPSALYEAIGAARLTPSEIRIAYYGPSAADVMPLAERHGVAAHIDLMGRIPHRQSLQVQRDSDILLLLQSPHDHRNVPAKLFEYFAAQRPILGIGLDRGVPARLITERHAGLYASAPARIAQALLAWRDEKAVNGAIGDLPEQARTGLDRVHQLDLLETFLTSCQRRPLGKT